MRHRPCVSPERSRSIAAVLFVGLCLACLPSAAGAALPEAATDAQTRYAADIEQLAKWCEQNGLAGEARKTRLALPPSDPYKLFLPSLPDTVGPPKLAADASAKLVEWHTRLWRLRRDYAVTLFDAARQAARKGQTGSAFKLATAALQADPDCEPARRLFGYQKVGDRWVTAYEARKLKNRYVWSDQFGWLPKANLPRYQQGERFCDGRWISAEEDARRHADIRNGWRVDTEHYTIRTNHSIEAAVALGVKLERLCRVWQQLFVRYYASPADIAAMFEGRGRSVLAPSRRYNVVYFRDRNDYNKTLRPIMSQVEMTTGVYRDDPPCAYFFAADGSDERSIYHEATHQLFYESRPVSPEIVRRGNFWIIEGIALFMESLRQEGGYCVLGGLDDDRMQAARYRLLHDNFYVPLGELIDFDMKRLQEDPRIGKLYSESAGLTHFLMFDGNGRFRDALVSYLMAVYSARSNRSTLAELTGYTCEELDKQYRAFVEAGARAEK